MVRDIEESKRTNNAIASAVKAAGPRPPSTGTGAPSAGGALESSALAVDCAIISDNYWPQVVQGGSLQCVSGGGDGSSEATGEIVFHRIINEQIAEFQSTYSTLKKPRKLFMVPNIGQVVLDLDFEDGSSRRFTVTPLQVECFFC